MSSSSHLYKEPRRSGYDIPLNQRLNIPIQHVSDNFNDNLNEHYVHHKDTMMQWINDSITDSEKFRITVDIDGFSKNEVHTRVDGNQLFVYGEHIENKSQGTSKKLIEKSYSLPPDVDTFRPHVTFPLPTTMQVDFPSRNSNNRYSTKHSLPQFTQSSGSRTISDYDRSASNIISRLRSLSPFDEQLDDNRNNHHHYRSNNHQEPIRHISIKSIDSPLITRHSKSPVYKFSEATGIPLINKNSSVSTKTVTETHHQRSSPTTGSPASSSTTDDGNLRSNFSFDRRSPTPPSPKHNHSNDKHHESSIFPRDFDSTIFYRSPFQPQIFTDDRHQRYIEMKLDVQNNDPNKIKISVNDNDLIVHAEHTNFYKRIALPSNTDLTSLSSNYHHDKKLYITAKLLDEYSSLKYI